MKVIAFFFFLLGTLSIVFNISHPPGLSGKSIEYYQSIEMRFLVGVLQLFIGLLLYKYSNKKDIG